jgi:hypothetical protein
MPSWMLTLHLPVVPISVISGRPLQREDWVRVLSTVLARGLVALRCPVDVKRERGVSDLRLHLTMFNFMNTTSEIHCTAITAVFFFMQSEVHVNDIALLQHSKLLRCEGWRC